MRHSNWVIVNHNNMVRDLIAFHKATLPRLSDERIDAISSIRLQSTSDVSTEWKKLPQKYKGVNNHNLGCA